MCEKAKRLSRAEVAEAAKTREVLMWECPREDGRLILRPAQIFDGTWPSIISQQLRALEKLEDPSILGVTQEECAEAIEALKKVYEAACRRFTQELLSD